MEQDTHEARVSMSISLGEIMPNGNLGNVLVAELLNGEEFGRNVTGGSGRDTHDRRASL